MTPQAKAKIRGRQTENAVVGFLNDNGYPYAERRRLKGAADEGDITGIPGVVIEVKGDRSNRITEWRRETLTEAENAKAELALLVVRLERQPVGKWDVHLPLGVMCAEDLKAFAMEEDMWVRMSLREALAVMKALGF